MTEAWTLLHIISLDLEQVAHTIYMINIKNQQGDKPGWLWPPLDEGRAGCLTTICKV